MYSVMWSEHCSYKSSKVHLRQFGEKAPKTDAMLVGIGENAGVVDIGDGWAVTFKVESHNHPSYVEPYQGAATGVGGIVRDIMSMGARPVAVMDPLRFGPADAEDTRRVLPGVVAGIGGYGNCLGLPNIGGEVVFDPSYAGNPLVNALCVGVMRHEDIKLAHASGAGNLVVLFGARTGGDGIGGVWCWRRSSRQEGQGHDEPGHRGGDHRQSGLPRRHVQGLLQVERDEHEGRGPGGSAEDGERRRRWTAPGTGTAPAAPAGRRCAARCAMNAATSAADAARLARTDGEVHDRGRRRRARRGRGR